VRSEALLCTGDNEIGAATASAKTISDRFIRPPSDRIAPFSAPLSALLAIFVPGCCGS
jgi:hypothetical protein